jgi:methyl-accepting chemotaxis protein
MQSLLKKFEDLSVITKLNLFVALMVGTLLVVALLGLAYIPTQDMLVPGLVMGSIILGTGAVAVWLRLQIRTGILRSIRAAAHVIGRVAEGDLTARVNVVAYGETQKMLQGLESMTRDLAGLVSQVSGAARNVADTSAQIAQGNLDLSQRTEEQATTLEETASSMEELTSTVTHNADNARQASRLANEAAETARKGGESVDEVVRTMDGILDASRRISDIIGVIDGIAFQTNILALNAAVEAARAGEQGRGFAVVAAEVRQLAHRTTAAAKEIKGLIADSERKVEEGSARVDEAGHTMVGVVLSVQKVSGLIAEIAAASQEQSAGIGQVNTAVSQMERVVQQNASLVEEAAAATESLKDQAATLLHLVSRFKIAEDDAARPARRLRPRRPVAPREAAAREPSPPPRETMPQPIRVRPSKSALPHAAPGRAAPRTPMPGAGQWEEF